MPIISIEMLSLDRKYGVCRQRHAPRFMAFCNCLYLVQNLTRDIRQSSQLDFSETSTLLRIFNRTTYIFPKVCHTKL